MNKLNVETVASLECWATRASQELQEYCDDAQVAAGNPDGEDQCVGTRELIKELDEILIAPVPEKKTGEEQTCPRRNENPGSFKMFPPPDRWVEDTWDGIGVSQLFPEDSGKPPRVCSYCGCSHPDDVANLVENRGWIIEPSTKGYKWYINQPKSELHGNRQVIPPVKLYGQHGSEEQLKKLNDLYDKQRKNTGR